VSDDIASVSRHLKFWDIAYQIDRNNVFGVIQFESRYNVCKIHLEARFCLQSMISTAPHTVDSTFYLTMGHENPLPTYTVNELMSQIRRGMR